MVQALAHVAPGQGEAIRVRGLVQGVGFRPAVWRLATECGLAGTVRNDAEGVEIRLWGAAAARALFLERLRQAVPLACIETLERRPAAGPAPGTGFRILESRVGAARTSLAPDAAVCAQCLEEIRNPGARRFHYPFTNCAQCGPRLTIARALPYDRSRTSMAGFPMCAACRAEYENPGDRRFHAQPIACPECGPRLCASIEDARAALLGGEVVAIKGPGGWQLAVDAENEAAVTGLRVRKRRFAKPFALMAHLEIVEALCFVDAEERRLLQHRAAPIVLLRRKNRRIAPSVAPGNRTLGFMLPHTPLHHLLLERLDRALVMTSGNVADEPQCIDDDDARARLADLAERFVGHDRPIVNRVDDSVARVVGGAPRLLRRARGYAPAPLPLPRGFSDAPPLLAMGGDLKSAFCLVQDGKAILSQHIGDLGEPRTRADYRRTLDLYRRFYDHRPEAVAVDPHPDYASTRLGRALGVEVVEVQHHHAHVAACLAENDVPLDAPPVLGIALDGLGYGEDGTLWGGEFLLTDYRGFRRLAHLPCTPLPGGARAAREPWRNTWAQVAPYMDQFPDLELMSFLKTRKTSCFASPRSSSCGRLFDAVAAALGICRERVSYEGEAAIALEHCADPGERSAYAFTIEGLEFWDSLLTDLQQHVPVHTIAARFHNGLADAVVAQACALEGFDTVALSGGCFQNAWLFTRIQTLLERRGFKVLTHREVPANDGGLALGQAAVAAARRLACA